MADITISAVEQITEFNGPSGKTIYIHQFKGGLKFGGWSPCACQIKASNPSMINIGTCPKYGTYINYTDKERDEMSNPLLTNIYKADAEKEKANTIEAFSAGLVSIGTFCKNTGIEEMTVNEIAKQLNVKEGDTVNRRERNQKIIDVLKQRRLL
jgi:hypothetical protein